MMIGYCSDINQWFIRADLELMGVQCVILLDCLARSFYRGMLCCSYVSHFHCSELGFVKLSVNYLQAGSKPVCSMLSKCVLCVVFESRPIRM